MKTKGPTYPGLNLSKYPGVEKKFEAVYNFLQITTVFCELKEAHDANPEKMEKDVVTKIIVPKGDPGYIQSMTKEIRKILIESIDNYLDNVETAVFDMLQTLKKLNQRCILESKIHSINNSIDYDPDRILYLSYGDAKPVKLYYDHLAFSPIAWRNLTAHFNIRKEFYEAMAEILDTKIADLSEPPAFTKQPYLWNSKSAKYEIAELLYALLGTRIQLKAGEKGAHAKLVKNFFNLFGYDENHYYIKQQQITRRKEKESWLHELTGFTDDVQKRNKSNK